MSKYLSFSDARKKFLISNSFSAASCLVICERSTGELKLRESVWYELENPCMRGGTKTGFLVERPTETGRRDDLINIGGQNKIVLNI